MKHSRNRISGGPRRSSEGKMGRSPHSDDTTHGDEHASRQRSKSESQHSLSKQKSDDRFRWKFRSFKGKRGSESKDRVRELVIVHTTHDEMPMKSPMVLDGNQPDEEERGGFILRTESEVSLRDRALQQTWQDYRGDGRQGSIEGLQGVDDTDDADTSDSDTPWILEQRFSAATALTTSHQRDGSPPEASVSTTDSDVSSLQSFLGETELHINDDDEDSDSVINEELEASPNSSPHTGAHHSSWNWAVPIQQPSALTPAPPPRPATVSSRPASPFSEPKAATATTTAAATAPALRANMVSLRRPSRPDNPWDWKLPAPDPSAPKINTVMVRRPSHAQWTPGSPNPSKATPVPTRRGTRVEDGLDAPPPTTASSASSTKPFSRRPSRTDESSFRPPVPPVPPIPPTSSLVRDMLRRPSRPDEALFSHPVRVRQDSVPDTPCRMCHSSIAEAWGVCRECEEELTPGAALHDKYWSNYASTEKYHRLARKGSRPAPIQTAQQQQQQQQNSSNRGRNYSCASMASYSSSVASSINTPTTGSASTSLSTPMTGSFPPSFNRLPPNVQSIITETETAERSPPISPTCRVAAVEVAGGNSSTSLSGMPTPDLLARYQLGAEKFVDQQKQQQQQQHPLGGSNLRVRADNEELATYFFDAENFEAAKNRPRTKSAVTQEQVQGFMAREVALEEYDGIWGDPLSPGPGWI